MGQNQPEGQGLFCAEISPDTRETGTFKSSQKNSDSQFEIVANWEAVILIGSNSVSSQNANRNLIAEILDESVFADCASRKSEPTKNPPDNLSGG
jgi:hypothetical protein